MDKADPRKLVEVTRRTSQDESGRHRDWICTSTWTLGVGEPSKVRTGPHAVNELPKRPFVETAEPVAGGAAKPLGKRHNRDTDTV